MSGCNCSSTVFSQSLVFMHVISRRVDAWLIYQMWTGKKNKNKTLTDSLVIPHIPFEMHCISTTHYCVPATDMQPEWSTIPIRVLSP
jgi:hypothetical protein